MKMGMVKQASSWDAIPNGGDEYDNVLDFLNILDFPPESLEVDGFADDFDASKLGPIPSDALTGLFPVPQAFIRGDSSNSAFKLKAPVDSASQHTEVLNDDDKKLGKALIARNKYSDGHEAGLFQTQSPVSVLESSASCSGGKTIPNKASLIVPVRTRTKRPRPSSTNPWLLISPISSTSPTEPRKSTAGRKKREKRPPPQKSTAVDPSDMGSVKKCLHCEVTKTPQWREGPAGPKTLCNACGVRYRSGRLFPEYRPAASPTFVPSLHSNSHRKVVEMRRKAVTEAPPRVETNQTTFQESVVDEEEPAMSPPPEFIPMSSYLFDCI